MLFSQHILDGIAEGRITLAFRRWKRPSVEVYVFASNLENLPQWALDDSH
jgi:hypothetical protein